MRKCPNRRERGTVLVIVLLVSLGLIAVTLYFSESMMLEYRASENAAAAQQAVQATEGARHYLLTMLKTQQGNTPGEMPDPASYLAENIKIGDTAAFWLIGRDPDANTTNPDRPTFGLIDEASKLNLNTATPEMLELLPNMTPEIAAAIKDWRDTDDNVTDGGAESDTYMLNSPPYNAKNFSFESPEELRLISGMSFELLYGEDTNRNGILDPNENDGTKSAPEDNQDSKLDPGLLEYVTVWSREPNTDSAGTKKTNIRGNNPNAVRTILTNTLAQDRVNTIWQAVGSQMANMRSLLEFYVKSGMTPEEFSQIEDQLTISAATFVQGRVNINSAPEAVLACIPGIGTDNAPNIIAYRRGKTPEDLKSISWVASVLDVTDATAAGPYLTTKSYQFTADVAALGNNNRGLHRDLFVIDTADGIPRVAYHRDLTRLGWPFGSAMREEFRNAKTQ